jgi:hypothetical protein
MTTEQKQLMVKTAYELLQTIHEDLSSQPWSPQLNETLVHLKISLKGAQIVLELLNKIKP